MICIIQSRMNSKRLPNKALKIIKQKTVLERVILNLSLSKKITGIIVATSKAKSDDPIKSFCIKKKIKFYRGDLKNVYQRYYQYLKKSKIKNFIRITGDSPLIDYRIVEKGINFYKNGNYDLVTNTLQRTYPQGQSVEIINTNTFCNIKNKILTKRYKEHITQYFYDNKKKFKIKNFKIKKDLSRFNLSVNTKKDYEFLKRNINKFNLKKNNLEKIMKKGFF